MLDLENLQDLVLIFPLRLGPKVESFSIGLIACCGMRERLGFEVELASQKSQPPLQ